MFSFTDVHSLWRQEGFQISILCQIADTYQLGR